MKMYLPPVVKCSAAASLPLDVPPDGCLKPLSVPVGPSQPVSTNSRGVLCGGGAVHALGASAPHTPAPATATATTRLLLMRLITPFESGRSGARLQPGAENPSRRLQFGCTPVTDSNTCGL